VAAYPTQRTDRSKERSDGDEDLLLQPDNDSGG
jgi:hypothetical protein